MALFWSAASKDWNYTAHLVILCICFYCTGAACLIPGRWIITYVIPFSVYALYIIYYTFLIRILFYQKMPPILLAWPNFFVELLVFYDYLYVYLLKNITLVPIVFLNLISRNLNRWNGCARFRHLTRGFNHGLYMILIPIVHLNHPHFKFRLKPPLFLFYPAL